MKKFIALLLSILILPGSFPACAENNGNLSDIKLDLKSNTINDSSKQAQTNEKPKNNKKTDVIYCNENSTDEMCKALEITKTDLPLESYLKKDYVAYSYIVKNSSAKNIKIITWNSDDCINPNNVIKSVASQRIRFPNSLKVIALSPVYTLIYFISVVTVVPMAFAIEECEDRKELFIYLTTPISFPAMGLWYTVASPYYLISDKINDKIAQREITDFVKEYPTQDIEIAQQVTFITLVSKKQPYLKLFNFYFKEKNSSNVYMIRK